MKLLQGSTKIANSSTESYSYFIQYQRFFSAGVWYLLYFFAFRRFVCDKAVAWSPAWFRRDKCLWISSTTLKSIFAVPLCVRKRFCFDKQYTLAAHPFTCKLHQARLCLLRQCGVRYSSALNTVATLVTFPARPGSAHEIKLQFAFVILKVGVISIIKSPTQPPPFSEVRKWGGCRRREGVRTSKR